tara:strand:+ start:934 stop:2619 length:1686 start_codon:yes stop_codon:yes gene_type:complete
MAQVAGGGSKAAVMADFNPKETTLRQVIGDYAEASRAKGSKLTGFEDKLFKSKALQTYLDNPVTELFDGHWGDADNPLIKVLNSVGEKSRGGYYSAIASLESNVFRQINRLRFNEEYTKLTDTVARPEKGVKYTSKFGYNPERLGSFHANLVEYVKNNPDSKPVANALLFQLYTGFRPNAAGGLTPLNIRNPQVRGGPHGIFISGSQLGAKGSPINVPLTRRAMAVLQSQEMFNENKFGGQQFIFQKKSGKQIKPIDDKDITGLLKKMQKANLIPEGLKVDVTGVTPKSSANLTAYDLRRLHATTLAFLQVPIEKAAMLTGRVVGSGGEQARYIGVSPGVFNPKGAALDANKLTDYMYQEYSRVVPGGMDAAEKDKKFLSRNRDIFSPNQPVEFVESKTDVFKGTYGQGTKLVQTTDTNFIEGDYTVLDDKPVATIEDASDATKKWFQEAGGTLKTVGKEVIKKLPFVAAGIVYAEKKQAGASTGEALGYAGSEFLPISATDADMAAKFARDVRDEGFIGAIGKTEEVERLKDLSKDFRSEAERKSQLTLEEQMQSLQQGR